MTQQSNPSAESSASRIPWVVKISLGLVILLGLFFLGRQAGDYVGDFGKWVESLGIWGPIAFIAGYAIATVAFIPGSILTMAGGAIFGLLKGTLFVTAGAVIGSTLAFVIARFIARKPIEQKLQGNQKFKAIDSAIAEQGGKIVFLLRLSPAFPYSLLNYALGLTKVRLIDYLWAAVGMVPGTFLWVYYGKAAGSLAAVVTGEGPQQGTEQWFFLAVGLLATIVVTAFVTRIARRALKEATHD